MGRFARCGIADRTEDTRRTLPDSYERQESPKHVELLSSTNSFSYRREPILKLSEAIAILQKYAEENNDPPTDITQKPYANELVIVLLIRNPH